MSDPNSPAGAGGSRGSKSASRSSKRFILMIAIPGALIAGALFAYLHAGRYVSTDNAYIKGHVVNVAPEVAGPVSEIMVSRYQQVAAGTPLLRLDDAEFRIAVARAEAALAQVESDINADKQAYRRALAELAHFRTSADYAATQHERQRQLRARNLGSEEDLDAAAYTLATAREQIAIAQEEAATLLARLDGDASLPVTVYPRYRQIAAELENARLNLDRTLIHAPAAGIVSQKPEAGDYLERGRAAIALVDTGEAWIEANFKETQLTHVAVGQDVDIEIDTYPGRHWRGHVVALSAATGAEFALLPPQNATGNWVKIVQRIPVKISIDQRDAAAPLRMGMSSTVSIDTGHVRTWHDLLPWE